MSIASTVQVLTQCTIESIRALQHDDEINAWLQLIGSMEQFKNHPDMLSEWEYQVQHFSFTDESAIEKEEKFNLGLEIFDLGRFNMYGKFDHSGTIAEFEKLIRLLEKAGVAKLPTKQDVDLSTFL